MFATFFHIVVHLLGVASTEKENMTHVDTAQALSAPNPVDLSPYQLFHLQVTPSLYPLNRYPIP